MSDMIYYKNGEETFRISPPTAGTKCPETKLEVKKMTEIEKTEGEIKVLQAKLELLKEMEKHKTPCEEAYKDWWGEYPPTSPDADRRDIARWHGFQAGYYASQEPKKEQKWDVVRESVKWCKEHREESVEDYLKPHTPEKTELFWREAFQKVQQTEEWKETQRKIDEEDSDKNFKNSLDLIKEWGEKNKPPNLKELLWEWWEDIFTRNSDLDADTCIDMLVDMIDKKFIPPSSDRNGYEWEKCLKMMRDKLRE
jgi:hypothetical protein